MRSKFIAGLAVAGGVLALSGAMWAHHSGSIYDRVNPLNFKGVVKAFEFTNPHVQVVFETTNAQGTRETWRAGSAPPQRLFRSGWNAKTLKPGDEIAIKCAPAKDGSRICSVQELVGPSGTAVLTQGAE